MKKIIFYILIIVLIFLTSVIKNSTKNLNIRIYDLKEDIRLLNEKHELVLLDHNFLSSPKKLIEYQKKYFENDLVSIDIKNIGEIDFSNKDILLNQLIDIPSEANEKKQ